VTGAHLGGRFETEILDPGKRVDGYIMTLEAIRARPWTGYGAGTFQDMFYLWNDGAFWLKFNYSHNLYLGAAVDLGLPAVAALFGAVALITFSCVRGVRRRRRDQAIPALGVAATALVAVHGLIDAPLIVPANAATYSFLLGLAYAQSWPSPSRNSAANRSPRAPPG
jgi:O-antigen ligase